jgi:hypothetical protein
VLLVDELDDVADLIDHVVRAGIGASRAKPDLCHGLMILVVSER